MTYQENQEAARQAACLIIAEAMALPIWYLHRRQKDQCQAVVIVTNRRLTRSIARAARFSDGHLEIQLGQAFDHLDNHKVLRQTILHELAHIAAGPGHGHDDYWVEWCRHLGIPAEATMDLPRAVVREVT